MSAITNLGEIRFNKEKNGIEIHLSKKQHKLSDDEKAELRTFGKLYYHKTLHYYYYDYNAETYAKLKESFMKNYCSFPTKALTPSEKAKMEKGVEKKLAEQAEKAKDRKSNGKISMTPEQLQAIIAQAVSQALTSK